MADSGPVTTRLAVAELERLASHFIKDSIAESTHRVYSTGQTTYFNFCTKFNLQPLPAPEQQLILFTADLSQRLSYSSLSVLKARYQLETTAEIGILQRLVLPLNKRIEASS